MEFAIVVVLVVVAVIVIAAVMRNRRSPASPAAEEKGEAAKPEEDFDRLRPPYREFHVDGSTAHVTFDVPLGPSGADDVLAALLVREAVEVTREKRLDQEVLDGLETVRAYGRRAGSDVFVGEADITVPDVQPDFGYPELKLGDVDLDVELPASDTPVTVSRQDRLPPLGEEIRLTSSVEAGLRAQGTDPDHMTAGDLVLGLLRLSGYSITPGQEHRCVARRAGTSLFVMTVPHESGSYPELEESTMRGFIAEFTQSKADRGWLVTEKFGPFAVYDSERRMPQVRFVTRERLQSVVDGFSIS